MNKWIASLSVLAFYIISIFIILLIYERHEMKNTIRYKLTEPMLIATNNGSSYYMIPTNTILTYQRGFSEGHQLYTIQVFIKGELPAAEISNDSAVESTWLYAIDRDDVSKILQNYPISRDDFVRILKSKKMTRSDLAEIVRNWKDD